MRVVATLATVLGISLGPFAMPLGIEPAPRPPVAPSLELRTERPAGRSFRVDQVSDLPPAWRELAMCESSGNPTATAGSRGQYQGLFQIEYPRTWKAHGGVTEPATAASVAEQYQVALHIYEDRGYKPWPHCGKALLEAYGR